MMSVLMYLLSLSAAWAGPVNVTKRASGKAGISWPIQEGSASPMAQFFGGSSSLSWWFDWNKGYGPTLFPQDRAQASINGQFIPMIFDAASWSNGLPLNPGWTDIMGWNEPDLHSSTGVIVAVDAATAAGQWQVMYDILKTQNPGAKVWSPAVAGDKGWLLTFFGHICPNGLQGCHYAPDVLSIHVYALDIGSFQAQVRAYHAEFGLPIAVSEYACYSWDGSNPQPPASQVSTFMTDTRNWMDGTPWIYKYAWFCAARNTAWLFGVAQSNRLLDVNGKMTALGQQWMRG